jgi:hypothetical protein
MISHKWSEVVVQEAMLERPRPGDWDAKLWLIGEPTIKHDWSSVLKAMKKGTENGEASEEGSGTRR